MNQQSVSAAAVISPQSLLAIKALHESIGLRLQERLSDMLGSPLEIELHSFQSATTGDFLQSRSDPSCLFRVAVQPVSNHWYLDVGLSLAYRMVDNLLGLPPGNSIDDQRPTTDFEWRILRRASDCLLQEMQTVWRETTELCITIEDPLLHLPSPKTTLLAETCLAIGWQLRLREDSSEIGTLRLCLPCSSLIPLHAKLLRRYAQFLATLSKSSEYGDPTRQTPNAPSLQERNTPVSVSLAQTTISSPDFQQLQVGDILMTEHASQQPVEIHVQAFGVYEGLLGAVQGMKAVEVTLTPEDTVDSEPCRGQDDTESAAA